MDILISVIVPTKNAEKTITRTLESISKQTYTNFEVLNIDYSSDNTKKLVSNYSKEKDKRIKNIQSNVVGLAKQRNLGISLAKGEYITFIDGDDTIEPTYLEKLLDSIIKYNADISCSNFVRVDSITNKKINLKNTNEILITNSIETCLLLETNKGTQLTLCQGKLLKKEFLLNHLINEETLNEDEATTYKWYFGSKKICILDEQLYNYYLSENSLSSKHNKKILEKSMGLCKTYEERYQLYKASKNKKLIFLGWKRLVDTSLQYGNIFKKEKNKEMKILMKSYFKKYKCIKYFFSHFKTYMILVLKYIRCI